MGGECMSDEYMGGGCGGGGGVWVVGIWVCGWMGRWVCEMGGINSVICRGDGGRWMGG